MDFLSTAGTNGWLLSLVVIFYFLITRGWRALSRWHRCYLMLTIVSLPFVFYLTLAYSIAGNEITWDDYLGLLLVGSWYFIQWLGIATGINLLIKMYRERMHRQVDSN